MTLIYSLILTCIALAMVAAVNRYLAGASMRTAESNQAQLCEKLMDQVDALISEMDNAARNVGRDSRLVALFSRLAADGDARDHFASDSEDAAAARALLEAYRSSYPGVFRVSVFNQYGDFVSAGAPADGSRLTDAAAYPFPVGVLGMLEGFERDDDGYGNLITQIERDHWSAGGGEEAAGSGEYMAVLRGMFAPGSAFPVAVVDIQMDAARLYAISELDVLEGVTAFAFDRLGAQRLPPGDGFADVSGEGSIVTRVASPTTNWSFALVQDKSLALAPYRPLSRFLYASGALLVASLVLAAYLISRRFIAPISALARSARAVTSGLVPTNFLEGEASDEVQDLNAALVSMTRRLKAAMEAEKRAFALALQSQMRPHFLNNTLANISGMVIEGRGGDAVEACGLLSGLLRYSAAPGDAQARLSDEIENAREYLGLLKLRYEEFLDFEIDARGEAGQVTVPRVFLQPLVENCFEHGFRDVDPPWRVSVSAAVADGGDWTVRVADDGAGASDEAIMRVRAAIHSYEGALHAGAETNGDGGAHTGGAEGGGRAGEAAGAGIGIGIATGKAAEGISRQPEASGKIMSTTILGAALAEATAIYGFVIALIILFMKWQG